MNILFTNFCNRNCPYCFAKGKLVFEKPLSDRYINFRNLKIIIDFLKRSKQTTVSVIGGEPTLHPEFKKAVGMIIKQGFYVTIFSNGLIKRDIVLFLKGLDTNKYNIVLNINSPKSYTKKEWFIINKTVRLLSKQVTLGFTIYQLDFNIDFMVKLIQNYNLSKGIRLGIAAPLFGRYNKYVEIGDFPKVAQKVVEFAEKNQTIGISLKFDCGFTLCSFTDAQLGKLFRLGTYMRFDCLPVIDVGPDLTVWRCFATSMIWNKKLSDFKDLHVIYKFYNEKFKNFSRVGATDKCFRCDSLKFGRCSGGCLGHILKSFKLENRLKSLV